MGYTEKIVFGNTSMERKRRCRTVHSRKQNNSGIEGGQFIDKDDYFQCQRYLATAGLN